MKRKAAFLIVPMLLAVFTFFHASAEENLVISPFDRNGETIIRGTTPSKNENVFITIFYPNKTYLDLLKSSDGKDVIAYQNQVKSDEKGKFSFRCRLNSVSGIYTLQIGTEGNKDIFHGPQKLIYMNPEKNAVAANELKKIETMDKEQGIQHLLNILSDNDCVLDLGLYYELFDEAQKDKIALLMYNTVKINGLDTMDLYAARKLFVQSVITKQLNDGRLSDVIEYRNDIEIMKSEKLAKWINKYANSEVYRKSLTQYISGKNYSSVDDLNDGILSWTVLQVIKVPDGIGNIKTIMNDYKDEIKRLTGYDVTNYDSPSNEFYSGISGKDYPDLKRVFEDYNTSRSNNNDYSSGPQKGGGGGSGKSKITPVYVDMEHTPDIPTGLPTQFDDMYQAEWAIEAVNSLFERGIIHGKTPSQFCPNDHITREEFTKLIIEYLGIGDVEEDFEINFHDVRKQDWHYEYIKKAVGAKIIRGFSDTEFGSGRYITRQDIAVIIYNAILYMEKALDNVESDYTFSDMYDVSEYAQEAVAILKALNILNGYEDNTFRPLNFATRAEAAKIIYSLDNIL